MQGRCMTSRKVANSMLLLSRVCGFSCSTTLASHQLLVVPLALLPSTITPCIWCPPILPSEMNPMMYHQQRLQLSRCDNVSLTEWSSHRYQHILPALLGQATAEMLQWQLQCRSRGTSCNEGEATAATCGVSGYHHSLCLLLLTCNLLISVRSV